MPTQLKYILSFVALGKACVLGASVGLALMGALNVAFAIAAQDWLTAVRSEYLMNYFAIGGGLVGTISQVLFTIIDR